HRGLDEGHECSLQVADLLDMLAEPEDSSFSLETPKEPYLQDGRSLLVVEDLHVAYPTQESLANANGVPPNGDGNGTNTQASNGKRTGLKKTALNGVSMTIRHGETVGVAGPSGCGKTTWLRVLMRLTHPSGGNVWFGDVPLSAVSRESIGRLIGYVGQYPF